MVYVCVLFVGLWYVFINTCRHLSIYASRHARICMHVGRHAYICMYSHMNVCTPAFVYVHASYIFMYACRFVCMYLHVESMYSYQ